MRGAPSRGDSQEYLNVPDRSNKWGRQHRVRLWSVLVPGVVPQDVFKHVRGRPERAGTDSYEYSDVPDGSIKCRILHGPLGAHACMHISRFLMLRFLNAQY